MNTLRSWWHRLSKRRSRRPRQGQSRTSARLPLRLERLEERLIPSSTPIPVSNRGDLVFDNTHDVLYIITTDNQVQRWDAANQRLLAPWTFGSNLQGGDITANDGFLYIAEADPISSTTQTRSIVHKVNTTTANVTDLSFPSALGTFDVVVNGNNRALVSDSFGTLREIDLSTDAITFSGVNSGPSLERSADRTQDFFWDTLGNIASFDVVGSNLTTYATQLGQGVYPSAVSRDGRLTAMVEGVSDFVSVLDPNLQAVQNLVDGDGGVAFDPLQDVLYTVDVQTSQVVAYDTNTWRVKYRLDVGEPLQAPGVLGNGVMTVSGDGKYLYLSTPSGVRQLDLPPADGVPTTFNVSGFPSFILQQTPGTVTVQARDPAGNIAPGYTGTVRLTSSDLTATFTDPVTGLRLPNNQYTFKPGDNGVKTFRVVLSTAGTQSLTATDTADAALKGSETGIQVHAPGVPLLPVTNRRDLVWDPTRDLLYITAANGLLQRYDPVTETLLAPFRVGTSLLGADITQDGRFLYVAEGVGGVTQALIRKVDLNTGAVTNLGVGTHAAVGTWDVVVNGNGTAFFTVQNIPSPPPQAPLPAGTPPPAPDYQRLYQIDLATDAVTVRTDDPGSGSNQSLPNTLGSIRFDSLLGRSFDRSLDLVLEAFVSSGPFFTYRPATDTWSLPTNSTVFLQNAMPAVERHGRFFSFVAGGGTYGSFTSNADGGLVYDPEKDVLYATYSNSSLDQSLANKIAVYGLRLPTGSIGNATLLGTIDVGEQLNATAAFDDGVMASGTTTTGGQKFVFLSTGAGVRAFRVEDFPDTRVDLVATPAGPVLPGVAVTFTAKVTGGNDLDRVFESVTFRDGSTVLGTQQLDQSGQATFTFQSLSQGTHTITATYGGETEANPRPSGEVVYNGSVGTLNFTVFTLTTTTLTAQPPSGTANLGDTVTFTATVTGGTPAARAGQIVTFRDGATILGTGALDDKGVATLSVTNLTANGHTITASYAGDSVYAASTGTLDYFVIGNPSSTALTASPASSTAGQQVTFTATVSGTSGTPTGSVTFKDGTTTLATVPLTGAARATLALSTLGAGSHTITAEYSGDPKYGPSQFSLTYAVTALGTATTLTSNAANNTSIQGSPVTFTAKVVSSDPNDTTGVLTRQGEQVTFREGTTVLGLGVLNATGLATLTISTLSLGQHTIAVDYPGDAKYAPSSGTLDFVVDKITTTVTINSTPASPISPSQSVTFTAAVVDPQSNPVGAGETMNFFDEVNGVRTSLGSATIDASGRASISVQSLTAGVRNIIAQYPGNNLYKLGEGAITGFRVIGTPTTTTLTIAPPGPVDLGQLVTFTAQVTSALPAELGDRAGEPVIFQDVTDPKNPVELGRGSLDANGQATFSTSLNAGTYQIVASYQGDAKYDPSRSTPAQQLVVNGQSATLTLTANPTSPAAPNQQVTFTLTAAGSSGTPTGTVTFSDNGTMIGGPVTLDANGAASFSTTTPLSQGAHTITASYSGDGQYSGNGTSISYTVLTVTTLSLAAAPPGSAGLGQTVVLTATLTGGNLADRIGQPIDFKEGATLLGTGSLDANGNASVTVTFSSLGTHQLIASYGGDQTKYLADDSDPLNYEVLVATSVDLGVTPAGQAPFGQSVTLTATVNGGIASDRVGETVEFRDGTTVLGTAALNAAGAASFVTAGLAGGTHTLTAAYVGDTTYAASSTSVSYLVTVPTTVTLQAQPLFPQLGADVIGQPATLTATVASADGLTDVRVDQLVTFSVDGTVVGTAPLSAAGQASLVVGGLAPGVHTFDAAYAGDGTYQPDTGTASFRILTSTSLALGASPATSANVGQPVVLSAAVTGGDTTARAGETVTFLDGTTVLGTGALDASGLATFTVSNLSPGAHTLVATYNGDSAFYPTSGTLAYTIASSTAMTLAATPQQPAVGQSVSLTATLGGGDVASRVGQLVTFTDGTTPLGSAPLDANGQATLSVTFATAGNHQITASYAGDSANGPASASLPVAVSKADTVATLVANPPRLTAPGQAVTFTVTVTGGDPADRASEVVTFLDGNAVLGNAVLDASGTATLSTSALARGRHTITATYAGDANYNSSSAVLAYSVGANGIFATGTDAGGGPNVLVFDALTGQVKFNFFPYDPRFTGGVRVAVGDVTGDGTPDLVTAPGPGGGPDIKVFDGVTGGLIRQFFAFAPQFAGGLYLASADANGDGFADVITGADAGGGPNVAVFDGKSIVTGQPIAMLINFFPYAVGFTGGVRVAAGDVNGDGRADLITGAGPGGGPNVSVINIADGALIRSFFPYATSFTGGVYVAAGDVNGDGKADVITGAGPGGGPNVSVFSGTDNSLLSSFFPYDPAFAGGVRVGAVDRNGDGRADVLCVAGPGGGPDVRTVNALTATQLDDFFAYDPRFGAGLFVAGAN